MRQMVILFRRAIKSNNTIALASFLIAFFLVSFGSFPGFLTRMMIFIIPMFALYEISVS